MVWPGVDGVQRAHHQMPRFRRAQTDFHRLTIAHFTDENHLRPAWRNAARKPLE